MFGNDNACAAKLLKLRMTIQYPKMIHCPLKPPLRGETHPEIERHGAVRTFCTGHCAAISLCSYHRYGAVKLQCQYTVTMSHRLRTMCNS
jgi:hypothetical protein